jgi:NADPH-dependent 2,4-dienoyl-CoA reductase/sulfur reductase-like enzyme
MGGVQRVVVVGADAAGMSAAHQALRAAKLRDRSIEVVAFEATDRTSYSACGIPYWIGGEVDSGDDLVARSAEAHREAGIDLRMDTPVTAVDVAAHTVTAGDEVIEYDDLVFTTGAQPILPDWALVDGALPSHVGPVHTLADGARWLDQLSDRSRPVTILGAGYIGLEMAEAALRRGHQVRLRSRGRVMSTFAPELSERVEEGLRAAGATVETGVTMDSIEDDDPLILAIGLEPRTALLEGQLSLSERGALRPDRHGQVQDHLWSAGDCCEVWHRVLDDWAYLPLGTHANKHGRALGDALGSGGDSGLHFDGALGTAITRFTVGDVDLEVSTTGLTRTQTPDSATSLVTEGSTASGYFPGAAPMAINVTADPATRRLLGVQIVGGPGAGKRIDVAAVALWNRMTVADLTSLDLGYAPPFSPVWDPVLVAARKAAAKVRAGIC